MSEVKHAVAQSVNIRGRYLIEAEGRVLAADSAAVRPDDSVAPEPTHYLLTALAVCALGSVEKEALDTGVPVPAGTASVTSVRGDNDKTRFSSVQIDVVLKGVKQDVAERLVAHFINNCPIYNTFKRGGPIAVKVSVTA